MCQISQNMSNVSTEYPNDITDIHKNIEILTAIRTKGY